MNEEEPKDPPPDPNASTPPTPVGDGGQFTQRIRHQQLSARVPENVARGTYATGSLVLNGAHEFIIDFLQTVTRPHLVAARVILPPAVAYNVAKALRLNWDNFTQRFGEPPAQPKPPPGTKPPSIEEIYEQLKLSDETAAGVYANNAIITHSTTDFCLDFIAGFYPRSTVAARIYMSAPQIPRMAETLQRSLDQYQQRLEQLRKQQPPPPTQP